MPSPNPTCYHQSATSNASWKACQTRFRLAYREGIRLTTDTDSQRQGTNWGAAHEIYANALRLHDPIVQTAYPDPKDYALAVVIEHLNQKYSVCPAYKTLSEWALERQILLTSFIGYLWYFSEDSIEFLASELPFELPIIEPRTGLPIPVSQAVRVGKLDHLIKWQGTICQHERKSTSRSIDPDSDYWKRSAKDDQISMYALAMRALAGKTPVIPADCKYGTTLLDVWHKPTIIPKMLTQAATAEFLESHEYMGQKFNVAQIMQDVRVNGEMVEVEPGKKGFAIRESIEMYGARLLTDIYERPEFYFTRKEIVRTDAELDKFEIECYSLYQQQLHISKHNLWTENPDACHATFKCQYVPICFGVGANEVCEKHLTPDGFRRIFVQLTVAEQPVEV